MLVDSPIWAYYLDRTLDEHRLVRERLPEIIGDDDVLLPSLIQMEVVHYVQRRTGGQGRDILATWLAQEGQTRGLSTHTVQGAADQLAKPDGLHLAARDAVLLFQALEDHADIVTHDAELAEAAARSGLRTHDPLGT